MDEAAAAVAATLAEEEQDAVNEQGFVAAISALVCIVLGFLFMLNSYISDSAMQSKLRSMTLAMTALQAAASSSQKMLVLEDFSDFMRVFGKPFLNSAYDMQQMLYVQVKTNYLNRALRQTLRTGHARQLLVFVHSVADFLGWLEVFRMQMQNIPSWAPDVMRVQNLIDDIKRMLADHTEIQGRGPKGSITADYDKYSRVMRLHHGEAAAIGSVIAVQTKDANSQLSIRVPMQVDEFLRAMTVRQPSPNNPSYYEYNKSAEYKLQMVLSPLLEEAEKLSLLDDLHAPKKRLSILQVLLCKLIDVLDPGVPWDKGPAYDEGEIPPYIDRNDRLTPLVQYLSPQQIAWLREREYFKDSDPNLCFPGFRQDLANLSQEQRDVHADLWSGACPPREKRRRPPNYHSLTRDKQSDRA